eukprot:c25858_g1_i1 orf=757-1011(+)
MLLSLSISLVDGQRPKANGHQAKQASIKATKTLDHIFTLRATIEEGKAKEQKIYCYFVDFHKAFNIVPRNQLFHRLKALDTPSE